MTIDTPLVIVLLPLVGACRILGFLYECVYQNIQGGRAAYRHWINVK